MSEARFFKPNLDGPASERLPEAKDPEMVDAEDENKESGSEDENSDGEPDGDQTCVDTTGDGKDDTCITVIDTDSDGNGGDIDESNNDNGCYSLNNVYVVGSSISLLRPVSG